jgi:hypothetical protein
MLQISLKKKIDTAGQSVKITLKKVKHWQPKNKNRFESDEKTLLAECKRIGPTGISVLNIGRANFATTYSSDFCEVIADLLFLYQRQQVIDPIARLADQLRKYGINSCRGLEMNHLRIKYLINNNIAQLGKKVGYRVLNRLTKQKCPICGKLRKNVNQHVRDTHDTLK